MGLVLITLFFQAVVHTMSCNNNLIVFLLTIAIQMGVGPFFPGPLIPDRLFPDRFYLVHF